MALSLLNEGDRISPVTSRKARSFMQLSRADSTFQHYDSFTWWKTLPFELRDVRISSGSRPIGFRFSRFIINIEAILNDSEIQSCGEADTKELAATKAVMELIERASLMLWHRERQDDASRTSNGWAAHETLSQAKASAVLELVERDAVLAQWYSSIPFLEIRPQEWPEEIAEWSRTELARSEFPEMKLLLSTEGIGPSLTCLFVDKRGHGVSGHASKTTLSESIGAAISEACRAAHHALRRTFWEDSRILFDRAQGKRVQPGAHAVHYAYRETFPRWMFGDGLSWADAEATWNRRIDSILGLEFSRFGFEQTLMEPAVVGFASHPQIFELFWGTTDAQKVSEKMRDRMFSSSMNGKTPNTQPHIVA